MGKSVVAEVAVGTRIQIDFTFTALDTGIATDPSAVAVYARDPDGNVVIYNTAPSLLSAGVGVYRFTTVLNRPGIWWFTVLGSGGTLNASEDVAVRARKSVNIG